jgi:hypothetical protein
MNSEMSGIHETSMIFLMFQRLVRLIYERLACKALITLPILIVRINE